MQVLINKIIENEGIKILIVLVVFDTIFGILRALREKNINSTIGIDGLIRKAGMLISVIFMVELDILININLIGFLPETIREYINIEHVGINELFVILYSVFETLSILKNMILCKLPIPKKLQSSLEKIMLEFTGEIKG